MRRQIKRGILGCLILVVFLCGRHVNAASPWYLSPSFPNEDGKGLEQDFVEELGGEASLTVSQVERRWKPVGPDEKGYVNLVPHFPISDNKVVYALATFDAEGPGIALWRFGSDDRIRIRVNGVLAYSLPVRRGPGKDADECWTRIVGGKNTVLLKVDNGAGEWGFYFRMAEVFPEKKGQHAVVVSLTTPPDLLFGSQYPIDQWAVAQVLNNGTQPLVDAVLRLDIDGVRIGEKAIDRLEPVTALRRRVRITLPSAEEEKAAAGIARVSLRGEEISPARSFSAAVQEVHPLLTGRIEDEDGVLRFIHATDPHVIAENTVLNDVRTADSLRGVVRGINDMEAKPDFVMVTGDLTLDSAPGLKYFADVMKEVRAPWLMVPGNHDKPGGEAVTVDLFGRHGLPLYYSFDYAGYHIVGMDGQPPAGSPVGGGIIPEQVEWLKRDLHQAEDKETIVFVHQHPLMTWIGKREDLVDWPQLVEVLESFPQVKWVYCGHAHVDYFAKKGGIRYILSTAVAYQFGPKEIPYFANEAGARLMEYRDGKVTSRFLRVDGSWRDDPSVMECPDFRLNIE